MKRAVVLPISAVLLAACGESPMEPGRATSAIAPVQASLSTTSTSTGGPLIFSLDFSSDFDRITADVLPGFKDAESAQQLRGHLADITAALTAGDEAEAARVLELARAVVTPDAVNDGDRGYIEMIFRDLDSALQP